MHYLENNNSNFIIQASAYVDYFDILLTSLGFSQLEKVCNPKLDKKKIQ